MKLHLAPILIPLAIITVALPASAQLGRDRPEFFEEGQRQLETEIRELQRQNPDPVLKTEDQALGQWQTLKFPDIGFQIEVPGGEIVEGTQEVKIFLTQTDTPNIVIFNGVSQEKDSSEYTVAYSNTLTLEPAINADILLQNIEKFFIETLGRESQHTRDIRIGNYQGREFSFVEGDETVQYRIYWIKNRIYLLMVLQQSSQSIDPPILSRFFQSFQLLE